MAYMLDTCIFNKVLDGLIDVKELPSDGPFFVTHVQFEEINRTKNDDRKKDLLSKISELAVSNVPTATFIVGYSVLGGACLGSGGQFADLKSKLDRANKHKSSNFQDALIGEAAIVNGYSLVTTDAILADIVAKNGGKVLHYE